MVVGGDILEKRGVVNNFGRMVSDTDSHFAFRTKQKVYSVHFQIPVKHKSVSVF